MWQVSIEWNPDVEQSLAALAYWASQGNLPFWIGRDAMVPDSPSEVHAKKWREETFLKVKHYNEETGEWTVSRITQGEVLDFVAGMVNGFTVGLYDRAVDLANVFTDGAAGRLIGFSRYVDRTSSSYMAGMVNGGLALATLSMLFPVGATAAPLWLEYYLLAADIYMVSSSVANLASGNGGLFDVVGLVGIVPLVGNFAWMARSVGLVKGVNAAGDVASAAQALNRTRAADMLPSQAISRADDGKYLSMIDDPAKAVGGRQFGSRYFPDEGFMTPGMADDLERFRNPSGRSMGRNPAAGCFATDTVFCVDPAALALAMASELDEIAPVAEDEAAWNSTGLWVTAAGCFVAAGVWFVAEHNRRKKENEPDQRGNSTANGQPGGWPALGDRTKYTFEPWPLRLLKDG